MTASDYKVTIVIPAFNEARTIAAVVESVLRYAAEVVVVDDASKDATGEYAQRAGAVVIRHAANRGYDASLNDGFAEAVRRGADVIVTFDADGEHRPENIPAVVAPIVAGEADLVITERLVLIHPSEKLFALYTWMRFGLRDPLCGFKAYHRRVYERFGTFDTLNSIGTELALRAIRAGYRFRKIPIERHTRADTSRFYARMLRANLRILGAMVRVACAVR